MKPRRSLALLSLLGTSCMGTGLGSFPPELVDLYDRARPDGTIEIELDRDGSVREMEAEVPVEALPQRILDVALEEVPGGRVTGGERELTAEGPAWEVKVEREGRSLEIVVGEDGRVIETEREIRRSEAPQAVLDAAEEAVPGGRFRSVEVIELGGERMLGPRRVYHVKSSREGATYKVVVAPDGEVLRAVREQAAEIEIPLPTGGTDR